MTETERGEKERVSHEIGKDKKRHKERGTKAKSEAQTVIINNKRRR